MSNKIIVIPTMYSGGSNLGASVISNSQYAWTLGGNSTKITGFSSAYDFTPNAISVMGKYGPYSSTPELLYLPPIYVPCLQ